MSETHPPELVIRTSARGWLGDLAKAYKERRPVTVIDDATLGIDPSVESLFDMGRKARLSVREWMAVLMSLGLFGAGVWMIAAALADPEPTSKLALLVAAGAICVIGGGFSAIRILTKHRPPSVEVGRAGIKIRWD